MYIPIDVFDDYIAEHGFIVKLYIAGNNGGSMYITMEETMEESVAAEKDILITRAHEYDRVVKETDSESVASKGNRVKLRKQNNFFLCRDHYTNPSAVWQEDIHGSCMKCLKYELLEQLPNGHLPNGLEVLEYLVTLKTENAGRQTNNNLLVAQDLCLRWIFCNIYPKDIRSVERDVKTMWESYDTLRKRTKSNKTDTYWEKYTKFSKKQLELFNIVAGKESREAQENVWNLKMCPNDWTFYNMQKEVPRRGFCTSFNDRKWELSAKRKAKRESRSRVERYDEGHFSGTTGDDLDGMNEITDDNMIDDGDHENNFTILPPDERDQSLISFQLEKIQRIHYRRSTAIYEWDFVV